jgi:hypothetical protein
MARLFNGTSQSIECVAPVTAVPLTICAWVYPTSAITSVVAAISTHSGAGSRFQLNFNASAWLFQAVAVDNAPANAFSEVSFSGALNTWYHVAAVYASSTSRTAYVNGMAGPVSSTSIVTSAPTRFNIGGRYSTGTLGGFFSGAQAEVSIHNAALTAEEIADLAQGFNPRLIRPQSRVYWNRLIRHSQDLQRGASLTDIGGATSASDHPRIIYP